MQGEHTMPQISLYVDEKTLKEVEKRAKDENLSISKWVGERIRKSVENEYPKGFFDLCGALKDIPFERPPQTGFEYDCPRENI
jgi:hypothetical protein